MAAGVWAGFALVSQGRRVVAGLEEDLSGAPIEVFAAPRLLRPGESLNLSALAAELRALGYRKVSRLPTSPGEYRIEGGSFELYRRGWPGPRGEVSAAFVRGSLRGGRLSRLRDGAGKTLRAFTCEPQILGAFRSDLSQARQPLPLESFPPRLVDAVLAAEDARFLSHGGIDPRGIVRAAWMDIKQGRAAQGGSTITQQVIKNRVVGAERSLGRKLKEALLALYVEGRVSKQRLLEVYLNEIYLGQRGSVSVIGVPAAARFYFGKQVQDLGLDEMALLAGMIASPGRYDPRRHPERAQTRRAWVLAQMAKQGFIDPIEQSAAAGRPLHLAPIEPAAAGGDLLDATYQELAGRGWEPEPGTSAAYVYTTIDPGLQAAARRALEETLERLEKAVPRRKPLEGAVVVLRPASGELVALVGGRHGSRGGFHRALAARRPPGSAFKPFVALAAMITGRWSSFSQVEDAPLEFRSGGRIWRPVNYDHRFRGMVTLRRALEESLNVPLARVGLDVGPQAIAAAAHSAGVTGRLPLTPSIALGAGEVSPLELAQGYATLVTLGRRQSAHLVAGVRKNGEAVPQLAPAGESPAALPAADCWLTLDALRGVTRRGTAKALAGDLGEVWVAAKTGTSQEGRDAWFVLATGSAVVVAWVGRDDNAPAALAGSIAALPVVRRLLASEREALVSPLPPPPPGVHLVSVDRERRCVLRRGEYREAFKEGSEPPPCERPSLWRRLFGRRKGSS